jgi:TolA-binding protein
MLIRYLLCFVLFSSAWGCASVRRDPFETGRLEKQRAQYLERQRRSEEKKLKTVLSDMQKSKPNRVLKSYALPQPTTEESLYTEVMNAYLVRDAERLSFMVGEFIQRYSKSIYADNALYLNAQMQMSVGDSSVALKSYEQILRDYPASNKYASALLGKGIAYRKLRLFDFSQNAFNEVKKNFPGSPESYKVILEEKLLALEKGL